MTTVPIPRSVNARSTGSRTGPSAARDETRPAARSSSSRSASSPAPVRDDTSTTGSSPASSATSSRTISAVSSSTRSRLVSATTPRSSPSSRMIARCSRVWGMTPSSSATTSRNRSRPVAPATIVRTNRSWPGTSTTDSRRPDGSSSGA